MKLILLFKKDTEKYFIEITDKNLTLANLTNITEAAKSRFNEVKMLNVLDTDRYQAMEILVPESLLLGGLK